MHRKNKLSWFDKLCWKLIEAIARKNPDTAVNMMGGGDPQAAMSALAARNRWDPRPRGVSSRRSD